MTSGIFYTLVSCAAGLVSGLTHASVVESLCHNYIQHASRAARDFYERHPVLCAPLMQAWRSHTVMHHKMTYRGSQTEQHRSSESELDVALYSLEHGFDGKEKYGKTVNWLGFLKMLIPFAPACGMALYCLPWEYSVPFAASALACPGKSKWFHPNIHEDYERTCREASWPARAYLKSPIGKFIWVYHDMHHRKPSINFNLVGFLGDLVTGRMKWPRAEDREIAFRRRGPRI